VRPLEISRWHVAVCPQMRAAVLGGTSEPVARSWIGMLGDCLKMVPAKGFEELGANWAESVAAIEERPRAAGAPSAIFKDRIRSGATRWTDISFRQQRDKDRRGTIAPLRDGPALGLSGSNTRYRAPDRINSAYDLHVPVRVNKFGKPAESSVGNAARALNAKTPTRRIPYPVCPRALQTTASAKRPPRLRI